MKIKLEDGQIVEDGYYPRRRFIGSDSGFRSKELDTAIHKQATLSRLDEVSCFSEIMDNKDYYEVVEEKRYYNLCMRCGYVKNSKLELHENTTPIYLDQHCKCGNPIQCVDISMEELHNIREDEKEREYQRVLFERDIDWMDNEASRYCEYCKQHVFPIMIDGDYVCSICKGVI